MNDEQLNARLGIAFRDRMEFDRDVRCPGKTFAGEMKRLHFVTRNVFLGNLRLPTGHIVAADPILMPDLRGPFEYIVEPGEYPVILTLAKSEPGEAVAFARISLSDLPAVRWEVARSIPPRPPELPVEEDEGYGVDSAIGCFADEDTMKWLAANPDENFWRLCLEVMKARVDASEAAGFPPLPPGLEQTLAVFQSGFGDGTYDSWWGFAEDDSGVCLLTDFNVVGDPTYVPRTD